MPFLGRSLPVPSVADLLPRYAESDQINDVLYPNYSEPVYKRGLPRVLFENRSSNILPPIRKYKHQDVLPFVFHDESEKPNYSFTDTTVDENPLFFFPESDILTEAENDNDEIDDFLLKESEEEEILQSPRPEQPEEILEDPDDALEEPKFLVEPEEATLVNVLPENIEDKEWNWFLPEEKEEIQPFMPEEAEEAELEPYLPDEDAEQSYFLPTEETEQSDFLPTEETEQSDFLYQKQVGSEPKKTAPVQSPRKSKRSNNKVFIPTQSLTRSNYCALEKNGFFGIIDTLTKDTDGFAVLVFHIPKSKQIYQTNMVAGQKINVVSLPLLGGKKTTAAFQIQYVTRNQYYRPGRQVTSYRVGISNKEWIAFKTSAI